MSHPDPCQLECYLDDELSDPIRETVRRHVEQCPPCLERLEALRKVGLALHRTLPTEQMSLSEAEFWLHLASNLPTCRPRTWPLVPFLPPLLLAMAGTLIQAMILTTLLGFELAGLGLMPSLGPTVSSELSSLVSHRGLQQWLHASLGWSSEQVAQRTIHYWDKLNWATQNVVIFVTVLLTLAVFMSVIVTFYSFWAMCWSGSARPNRQKEVWDHGIRSYR